MKTKRNKRIGAVILGAVLLFGLNTYSGYKLLKEESAERTNPHVQVEAQSLLKRLPSAPKTSVTKPNALFTAPYYNR